MCFYTISSRSRRQSTDSETQKLTFVVSLFHFPLLEALAAASRAPRRCNSLTMDKEGHT